MKAYRIVNNDYDGEIVLGLPYPFNQTNGEQKLIKLFSKMKPWTQCVPYYKKSHFAFISKNALLTFLFSNKDIKLTPEDVKELDLAGWKVESFELSTWSRGQSNFLCTYFNDEIIENTFESYTFDELYNISYSEYSEVIQYQLSKQDINEIKGKYYTDIETHYEY